MQRIYGFLIFLGLALLFGMMVRSFPCESSFFWELLLSKYIANTIANTLANTSVEEANNLSCQTVSGWGWCDDRHLSSS